MFYKKYEQHCCQPPLNLLKWMFSNDQSIIFVTVTCPVQVLGVSLWFHLFVYKHRLVGPLELSPPGTWGLSSSSSATNCAAKDMSMSVPIPPPPAMILCESARGSYVSQWFVGHRRPARPSWHIEALLCRHWVGSSQSVIISGFRISVFARLRPHAWPLQRNASRGPHPPDRCHSWGSEKPEGPLPPVDANWGHVVSIYVTIACMFR